MKFVNLTKVVGICAIAIATTGCGGSSSDSGSSTPTPPPSSTPPPSNVPSIIESGDTYSIMNAPYILKGETFYYGSDSGCILQWGRQYHYTVYTNNTITLDYTFHGEERTTTCKIMEKFVDVDIVDGPINANYVAENYFYSNEDGLYYTLEDSINYGINTGVATEVLNNGQNIKYNYQGSNEAQQAKLVSVVEKVPL